MTNILLLTMFGIAIALTLLSAWVYSSFAYYLIVFSYVAGFATDIVSSYVTEGTWNPKMLFGEACIFGCLFYFVTIHKITGQKVSGVVTGKTYKDFLIDHNMFYGFYKFIYYLPIPLIAVGVCTAVYWKFAS